ncbi:hypothetical protein K0U91_01150 [Chryseobacterium chendengshani]|uniref:hypothetical protein n=1 Tax=Chryseobacterium sp. LJ668 TaxID=2864040 RepID=UPI001C687EC7|nr:hypothetical protein [Chryseobacterium sp. LJ668]MBW8523831.1 hypothetical protein [Chryseobacterium sp. LJ668]QYK16774.1 hypothetical protein K0U91_01150 [Chryseobacterium sp. LJ668]
MSLVFDTKEKKLMLAAIDLAKKNHEDKEDSDYLDLVEIENEVMLENIFLSRKQISHIETITGPLLDFPEEYEQMDIYDLETKLLDYVELP